jgi:hypothetical protein
MKIFPLILGLVMLPIAAAADDGAGIVAAAKADCANFEGGVFTAPDDPFVEVELAPGVAPAQVLDTSTFRCSTMASFASGTGGSVIYVFAGDKRLERMALGWQMVDWSGQKVLLFALHGSECGAVGAEPCFEAVALGSDGFLTLRGVPQPE